MIAVIDFSEKAKKVNATGEWNLYIYIMSDDGQQIYDILPYTSWNYEMVKKRWQIPIVFSPEAWIFSKRIFLFGWFEDENF